MTRRSQLRIDRLIIQNPRLRRDEAVGYAREVARQLAAGNQVQQSVGRIERISLQMRAGTGPADVAKQVHRRIGPQRSSES